MKDLNVPDFFFVFKNFKKMKKGKTMNKNSIKKICKVFVKHHLIARYGSVPLLSSSDIPHLLQDLQRSELGCTSPPPPPSIYLVITISHLTASDCFHVHFVQVLGGTSTMMFAMERSTAEVI